MGRKYRKWTIEALKEESSINQTLLLSKEYCGVDAKYIFKCSDPKHPIYVMSWNNFHYKGQRCPKCKYERVGDHNRIPFEKVQQEMEVEGYRLLSKGYKNARQKLKMQCPDGHEFWTSRDKFVNTGTRCPKCSSNHKHTLAEIQDQIKILPRAEGYRLLSNAYDNVKTKLKFQCAKQHIFWMT